ncbi:MAG: hypothetical protein Q8J62_09890, partial [Candidatus Cloacimonadaceae bacterium]|nr:hypothetical protein [Candidatus Cloacimonadaceae bacterium]
MRTIYNAVYKIASDSSNPKTVYVANGTYSSSLNGQIFPIPLKSYMNLVGESQDGTILDAEYQDFIIYISAHSQSFNMSQLKLINGKAGVMTSKGIDYTVDKVTINSIVDIRLTMGFLGNKTQTARLSNLTVSNVSSPQNATGVRFLAFTNSIEMTNVEISDCRSYNWMPTLEASARGDSRFKMDGCRFYNNSNYSGDVFNTIMQVSPDYDYGQRLRIEIKNSAFYNNYQVMSAQMANIRALNDTVFISNCTFADNSGGTSAFKVQGNAVLTNNIIWNPLLPREVIIPNNTSAGI